MFARWFSGYVDFRRSVKVFTEIACLFAEQAVTRHSVRSLSGPWVASARFWCFVVLETVRSLTRRLKSRPKAWTVVIEFQALMHIGCSDEKHRFQRCCRTPPGAAGVPPLYHGEICAWQPALMLPGCSRSARAVHT